MTASFRNAFYSLAVIAIWLTRCNYSEALETSRILNKELFAHYIRHFNNQDFPPDGRTISNHDTWKFLKDNIPFFTCPDKTLESVYYFRWWSYRKHLYHTEDGWVVTEFLPDVPWSGKHNVINCPGGHHIYEGRWLRNPVFMREYINFYVNEPESKPRNFSFWMADAVQAFALLHPDPKWEAALLPDLVEQYDAWEDRRDNGNTLYWQTDLKDGMEYTAGGRVLRNSDDYHFRTAMIRPTINAYMYGDALAISTLAGKYAQPEIERRFLERARLIKEAVEQRLWNKDLNFFTVMKRDYEDQTVPADIRELIGYVPWYFNLPSANRGYEEAWSQLMDDDGFYAPYGPTTCEQRHPYFAVEYHFAKKTPPLDCQWNGPSWPFATTQTLVAMKNLLRNYSQRHVDKEDWVELLKIYANSHQYRMTKAKGLNWAHISDEFMKGPPEIGQPWIGERLDPYTGNWMTRIQLSVTQPDQVNRGKDYNHSAFCDLVISGLCGIEPGEDETLLIDPFIPPDWDWFCIEDVFCKGRNITVIWDRSGEHFDHGKGFSILVDGETVHHSNEIQPVTLQLHASD